MNWEVTLCVSGKTFKERMIAKDYEHAKRVALARNPGARVIAVNPVVDRQPARMSQGFASPARSSDKQQASNSQIFAQPGGCAGLLGLAVLIGILNVTGLLNNSQQPVQQTEPKAPALTEDNQQPESSAEPNKTNSYYNQPLEQSTSQEPVKPSETVQDAGSVQLPSWQDSSFQNQLNQEQRGQ